MLKNKLLNFINESIINISLMFLGYLVLMCLFFQTSIGFGGVDLYPYEFASISKNSVFMIFSLLLGAYIFLTQKNKLKNLDEIRLFLSFSAIYLIFGILMIFNSSAKLNDDVLFFFNSARDLNRGIYTSFLPAYFYDTMRPAGYLYHNPHQLGLVSVARILFLISDNIRFFEIINLFLVIATNYYIWKTVKLLAENNKIAANAAIVISFLFFPQLFFILFVYGILPANLLIIASYYNFLKYFKFKKAKYLVFHILLIALAVLIKENSLIALMAFLVLYGIKFLETKKKIWFVMPIAAAAVVFISIFSLKQFYRYEVGHELNDGMPKLSYLYMGIAPNDSGRLGGWWNGYNIDLLKTAKFDEQKIKEKLYSDLNERIKDMVENPIETYKFFSQKITSIWTDSMFESIWSGPLQKSRESLIIHNLFHDFSNTGPNYKAFKIFSNILLFFIYLSSFLFIFAKEKTVSIWLFPYLYFLGGFVFHIFWEAKSQYAMTYVLMLIPICSLYVSTSDFQLKNIIQKYKPRTKAK